MNSFRSNLQAGRDLLGRYGVIVHHTWGNRRQTDTPKRLALELAFLPAALELTERPPHPAPLWTARLLVITALIVVLISAFGRLDIVAVAPGQLIPNANIKVIQPAVTGVVRRIFVQNGERVAAGEILVALDSTQATADADKATTSRLDSKLTVERAQALLTAEQENSAPKVALVKGATPERQADAQRFAEGAFREYRQNVAAVEAELQKREAALATTRAEIAKLQRTAPLSRREADDYKDLAAKHFVSVHNYLDKEKTAIEQKYELAAQESHARELEAGIEEQRRVVEGTVAAFQREQWETVNRAHQDAAQGQDEETKANARRGLMQLTSPVAGVVQQLNVHTVGGVVASGQTLMEIVPDDTLEVEARISNKDIGFVYPGQSAIIKIATFPYSRFGYLTGKLVKVSNSATADKRLGSVFLARIQIPSNRFEVDGKWVDLSPGMEVSAEIKTGKQKVWQYFLKPLIETGRESLRER
jgi:hemolysin D